MRTIPLLTSLAVAAVLASGCAPVVVGGAATAGYAAVQDRGAKGVVSDTSLKTHIKDKLFGAKYQFLSSIEVTVYEGYALLTGMVPTAADARLAEIKAREVPGIKGVYNEIFTGSEYPAGLYAKDSWIATQIRGRLLSAQDVDSVNFVVNVVNTHAFIMGLAKNQAELQRVLHIAGTTEGVTQVHNYIRIFVPAKSVKPVQ